MNAVLTYFVARDAGWLRKVAKAERLNKRAFNTGTALGIAGVALGVGGGVYGHLQRGKMKDMERKRELIGAINDTMTRRRIKDIYGMAGLPDPSMPLAVSKKVSPEYRKALAAMYGPGEKRAGRNFDANRVIDKKKEAGVLKALTAGMRNHPYATLGTGVLTGVVARGIPDVVDEVRQNKALTNNPGYKKEYGILMQNLKAKRINDVEAANQWVALRDRYGNFKRKLT